MPWTCAFAAALNLAAAALLARAIRLDTTNPPGNARPLAQRYVDELGQTLAAQSHRKSLTFAFTVLD